MNSRPPQKKSVKRAFTGLTGSPLAKTDDTVVPPPLPEPDLAAVMKEILTKSQKKYVSSERGIRRLGPNQYTDVKLSSSDRDPAFTSNNPPGPEAFQEISFDSGLGGTDPQLFAGDHKNEGAGTEEEISPLAEAAQAMGEKGYAVEVLKGSRPRSVPWWFPLKYRLLVLHRDSKYVHATVRLDAAILWNYYIERWSDAEILRNLKDQLRTEIPGRSKWTRSVNAVKNRRIRLVKEGDTLFGPNPDARPTPSAVEVVQGPPTEIERLQMIVRGDFKSAVSDEPETNGVRAFLDSLVARPQKGWTRERCIQDAQEKLDRLLKEKPRPEASVEPESADTSVLSTSH